MIFLGGEGGGEFQMEDDYKEIKSIINNLFNYYYYYVLLLLLLTLVKIYFSIHLQIAILTTYTKHGIKLSIAMEKYFCYRGALSYEN